MVERQREGEEALVLRVEGLGNCGEAALVEVLDVDVDRQLQPLAVVADVDLVADAHLVLRHLFALERAGRVLGELAEDLADLLRRGVREPADERPRRFIAHGRRCIAKGTQHARARRDDRRPGAQQSRQGVRMQRARAAEGDQRVVARVVALLDRHEPERTDHVLVDDIVDAECRILDRLAEALAHLLHRGGGRGAVEFHVATKALHFRQVAEHDVGVGDGRFRTAPPVRRGAGIGAGRLRTDAQRLGELRHVGDGATARAHGADVDRGGAHRNVADRRLTPQSRLAVHDQRDVCRGAADVDRQQVREAGLHRDPERAGDAASRA